MPTANEEWHRIVPQVGARHGMGTDRQRSWTAENLVIVVDEGRVTLMVSGVEVRMSVGQAMQVSGHIDAAVAEVERRDDEDMQVRLAGSDDSNGGQF